MIHRSVFSFTQKYFVNELLDVEHKYVYNKLQEETNYIKNIKN